MEYSFRASMFTKEATYKITGENLEISEEGKNTEAIPLSDILKLKLSFVDPRKMEDYYLCKLYTRSGKVITIRSTHFKALADFEDRKETYTPFVVKLHQVLPKSTQFRRGSHWGTFLFTISMLALLVLMLLFFGVVNIVLFSNPWIGVLLIVIAVFAGFRFVKNLKNRPSSYDLNNIPVNLLPK